MVRLPKAVAARLQASGTSSHAPVCVVIPRLSGGATVSRLSWHAAAARSRLSAVCKWGMCVRGVVRSILEAAAGGSRRRSGRGGCTRALFDCCCQLLGAEAFLRGKMLCLCLRPCLSVLGSLLLAFVF